ncbi:hypothetical protein VK92_38335 [Burkholderia sp. LK4]|nr:hypothetical protein VK92_38335 [Burkholderia sp. LK4]
MALSCRKLDSYLKVISGRVGCAKSGIFSSVLDFAKIWIVERTKYSVWTPVQMLLVEGGEFALQAASRQLEGNFFQIFHDFGEGYAENFSEVRDVVGNGEIEVFEFGIPPDKKIKSLRFDPSNGSVVIKVDAIVIDSEMGREDFSERVLHNAEIKVGASYFFIDDPQISIPVVPAEFSGYAVRVLVTVRYLYFGWDARIATVDAAFKGYVEQLSRLRLEIADRGRP